MPVWVHVSTCCVLKESHLLNSILAMLNLLHPHPEKLNKCLYIFSHWHLNQMKQENFQVDYSRLFFPDFLFFSFLVSCLKTIFQ